MRKWGLHELISAKVPVDIEQVAMALGVKSIRRANIPVAGMLIPEESGYEILLNKSHSELRQRFSCAHEIAHALLNPDFSPAMRSLPFASDRELEKKCETMAAMLLMPDPPFTEHANMASPSLRKVIELSELFRTSIQATALRYVDVIEEPCFLIVSELRIDEYGRTLRLKWPHFDVAHSEKLSLGYLKKGEHWPLTSAMLAYRSNDIHSGTEELNFGDGNLKIYSESRAFGNRDARYVLTLIFPDRDASSNNQYISLGE